MSMPSQRQGCDNGIKRNTTPGKTLIELLTEIDNVMERIESLGRK